MKYGGIHLIDGVFKMKYSPMWPIWAEDYCVPLAEARKAWEEYINGL